MKKLLRTSFAAMAAAFLSLALFSCGPDEPDNNGPTGPTTVAVTGVTLNKTSLTLVEGGSEVLTATIAPSNATNKSVNWKSSDAAVASVDVTGNVFALKAGTATITVTTTDGSKTATCSVTVTPKTVSVSEVTLDKAELEITEGESAQLNATVKPDDASDKSVEWTSSDAKVATVDAAGKVTTVGAGTATITVKTKNGGKTTNCVITVIPKVIPIEGVAIEPETLEITEGETFQLKATVNPEGADQEVEWASQNSLVATVDESGLVTAIASGETRIIVRSKADTDIQGYCELTVKKDVSLKGISLNMSNMNINVGGIKTLSVICTPTYAANQEVTWVTSDPLTVSVMGGKVLGLMEGTATITATSVEGGFTAECLVTVSKAQGPFLYSVNGGRILIDGDPDPLDGAFNDYYDLGFENNYQYTYNIDSDGKDIYSLERYSYRDWLCINRKPIINLNSYDEYAWRLNYEMKSFAARGGVFVIMGQIGQYDFQVLRVTKDGDYKEIKVHTAANNLIDMAIDVAPDGTIHAVSAFKDTFWDECLYWYKITPDGKVTEKLVEKVSTSRPCISVSDKGDVYILVPCPNGDGEDCRLYKNGVFLKIIDEVEMNFQGAVFCSGDNVYTAVSDYVKKELRVHKDGKKVLTLGSGKGAFLGYSWYDTKMWVTSEGDIYVSWSDSDGKYYLTKNNKVLYTASENMFYNFCVIE